MPLLASLFAAAALTAIPPPLAAQARYLASHGGSTGPCHGCATPTMKRVARRVIRLRFAPAGERAADTAVCIVGAESGFNPAAVSATGDYGLPQVNYVAHHDSHPEWWLRRGPFRIRLFDPVYAAGVMWSMSSAGTDWSAWTGTYGRGQCR